MTVINVYDTEADRIEKICNELDVTEAQVIEALFNALDWNDDSIEEFI